ncbi:MAG: TusE/DsrC/DsvC family sulfur relay protein, partial [Rheinheimera sp.]
MLSLNVANREIPLDQHGYLADLDLWTEALALEFARLENINMSAEHWEVVLFVRDFYQEFRTSPAIRVLVKAIASKL